MSEPDFAKMVEKAVNAVKKYAESQAPARADVPASVSADYFLALAEEFSTLGYILRRQT